MSTEEFDNQYMSHILEKISFENKEVYLLDDFGINFFNYETDRPTGKFLDNIYSNSFVLCITLPTRITPRFKTLIDNIFFKYINEAITLGNLITDISDHCVQFLITPNVSENKPNKFIYKRYFKNLMKIFLQMISKKLNGKLSFRLT